jgi:hypothetical protein
LLRAKCAAPAPAFDMLSTMQQSAAAAPSAAPSGAPSSGMPLNAPAGFAGVLASALPPKKPPASTWSDDGLADDVATLSYEQALRAHSRYRRPDELPPLTPQRVEPGPDRAVELQRADAVEKERLSILEEIPGGGAAAASAPAPRVGAAARGGANAAAVKAPTPLARKLKSASVTIRLSESESAQLRTRAAESGLTVSAYLRSCTFEAEALRAQVKEALAQLRSSPAGEKAAGEARKQSSWRKWVVRFWPHFDAGRRTVRA